MMVSYTAAGLTTRVTTHRLRLLSGRLSTMATRSPIFAVLSSSCATNFDVRRSVLPYKPCRTCHSTATTQVFCILLLTTTPSFSVFSAMFLFLRNHGLDARQVAAREAQLERRIELAERLLNAHPEQLILELLRARLQVVHRQIALFRHVHHDAFSSANRVANFVWMGSFDAASFSASRASAWVTP